MRLIDADALLEKMSTHCDLCQYNDHIHHCRHECDWHEAMDEVEDMDEVQSITINAPEELMERAFRSVLNDLQLRGHWEFIGGYGYQYRCSRCVNCVERKTKYCPNCGAKMDGVSE